MTNPSQTNPLTKYFQIERLLLLNELLFLFITNFLVKSWPDGAPCIHSVMNTMNPLEAVEHQGGLQLTEPPFRIEVDQRCYWRNQPIAFTLEGKTEKNKFKGFAIQPFAYQTKRRVGQFVRLDDNGSWQFQCFRNKDSITHSHDEGKKRMKMWWKSPDSEAETVQFVATVVVSLRQFWVQSVVSAPIPPCRQRQDFGSWNPPLPTVPPQTGSFKLDTFQLFNGRSANLIADSIASVPIEPPQRTFTFAPVAPSFLPATTMPPRRLSNVIPFGNMARIQFQTFTFAPVTQSFLPATTMPPRRLSHVIPLDNMQINHRPNFQQTFQQSVGTSVCQDRDPPQKCFTWIRFCPTSTYMSQFCRKTCQMC